MRFTLTDPRSALSIDPAHQGDARPREEEKDARAIRVRLGVERPTTGFSQAPGEIFGLPRMGSLFSIGIDAVDGTPQYLESLTIEQNVRPDIATPTFSEFDHWSIGGLDYLNPDQVGGPSDRNVLAVIATHARNFNSPITPQDRLFLVEDS